MNEDFMYFIWQSGGLFDRDLRTTEGKKISVLRPGYRNRGAGPDFFDARIRIGDITWYGPVEFHLKTSDWDAHKHTSDPAYNNVILHVVMEHDREIETGKGVRLPTLSLQKYIDQKQLEKYRQLRKTRGWIPCDGLIETQPKDFFWSQYLSRLAVERHQNKAERILKLVESQNGNWDAVIYSLIARYLAGKVNSISMTELVERIPYKLVLKYRSEEEKIHALFFGQSGLLNTEKEDKYFRELKALYDHLSELHDLESMASSEWCYMPVRPPAFPTIRIAQLCNLMRKGARPMDLLLNADSASQLVDFFSVDAGDYWRDHYVFGKMAAKSHPKKVGKTTAVSLVLNMASPVLFAYGTYTDQPHLREKAIEWLEELPPESNRIVRKWKKRGIDPGNALESQALLELKFNYCSKNRCLECALGSKLLREMISPYLPAGILTYP
jgi:hypothetical protein